MRVSWLSALCFERAFAKEKTIEKPLALNDHTNAPDLDLNNCIKDPPKQINTQCTYMFVNK